MSKLAQDVLNYSKWAFN